MPRRLARFLPLSLALAAATAAVPADDLLGRHAAYLTLTPAERPARAEGCADVRTDAGDDPGYRLVQRTRVLVLADDVGWGAGAEPVRLPERVITWKDRGNIAAFQDKDFARPLADRFRWLGGPEARREDWVRAQIHGPAGQTTTTIPPRTVRAGERYVLSLALWEAEQTEERSVGEGPDRRSGTRRATRLGVTTRETYVGPEEEYDLCSNKKTRRPPQAPPR